MCRFVMLIIINFFITTLIFFLFFLFQDEHEFLQHIYTLHQPEIHDVVKGWANVIGEYEEKSGKEMYIFFFLFLFFYIDGVMAERFIKIISHI